MARILAGTAAFVLLATAALAQAAVPIPQEGSAASEVAAILAEISSYDYGDSREPLSRLRRLVQANLDTELARGAIEQAMIEFLGSDATFAGKQFVCEQLSIVGSGASVPVLTGMLAGEPLADIALFALQRIPDPAVDTALRASLDGAERSTRIAIVNTLGERGDEAAVGQLAGLIENVDRETALAVVSALGKIAGPDASSALLAARSSTSGALRDAVLDSYMLCADRALTGGHAAEASAIYRDIYEEERSARVRAAALRGLVDSDPDGAVDTLLAALRRDNQAIQSVAAGLVRELPPDADLTPISVELASFSDPTQIQLLSALAHRGDLSAHEAVLVAAKHHDEDVRAWALAALGKLGGRSDVELLLQVAASGSPESNRDAARAALDRMTGAGIDELLISAIEEADSPTKVELVRSLGARNSTGAVEVLLVAATDPDRAVRAESFKSLAIVAEPDRVETLIGLLVGEADGGTRNEAERTVVVVSEKTPAGDGRAAPVMAAMGSTTDVAARASLIEVLGRIGDTGALVPLRSELSSETPEYRRAAIAALSVWPDAAPSGDLLHVAESSESEVERILALRGYIELTRLESDRPESESIDRFQTAMSLATELSEMRMVLAGLGELRSAEALEVTVPYLDNPDLRAEAEAALLRQIGSIRQLNDEVLSELLDAGLQGDLLRILDFTENERLRSLTTELLERSQ
jgi:HEAT repeat protein